MKRQIKDIVISAEMAGKLKDAGIKADSIYGYFKGETGDYHVFQQDDQQSGLPAYTSGELADLLPAGLVVDSNTWRATSKSWIQITIDQGSYPFAHLHTLKTDGSYMSGYYYDGTMIAFSKNDGGTYNNLLLNGETEQEARANLLLELISEGKFNNADHANASA